MKRYSFRLAAVLRVRKAQEELDRARLMASNTSLRTAIERRDAQHARCEALGVNFGQSSLSDFLQSQQAAELAAHTHAQTSREVTNTAAVAALAQIEWLAASRRVAIIERLEERRREEYRADELRTEIALGDDLVTARYVIDHRDDAFGVQS